jgi:uncharacterized protein (TIGR02996 family)
MRTLRQALEEALAADPDDEGALRAYADHLAEVGDPWGELMQVQVVLEGPEVSSEEYRRLRRREAELLEQHERDWLGSLARLLLKHRGPYRYRLARGWLERLVVPSLNTAFAEALRDLPLASRLRSLAILFLEGPGGRIQHLGRRGLRGTAAPLEALAGAPFLATLRSFGLGPDAGFSTSDAEGLSVEQERALYPLVRQMPRLTELRLGGMRDAGVYFLLREGFPRHLEALDLRGGRITDEGARWLAAQPDVRRLRLLDLGWNRLTPAAVAELQALELPDFRAIGQQAP